ncbi:MAG: hypothetical protein ACXADY_20700 [Candidatus Hodarchaeales archaeon]
MTDSFSLLPYSVVLSYSSSQAGSAGRTRAEDEGIDGARVGTRDQFSW